MIAWMCARMDGDNYGKLLVYDFPKQETIFGPEQVESRINQNTEISQQLSLWDQRGSRFIAAIFWSFPWIIPYYM
jgi:uncharacterized membrane protein (UPF0182 family)